jgi:membrane-associated phospholipid phosphatase
MTKATLAALSLALAAPAPADAEPPAPLHLDVPLTLATTGGALAAVLASELLKGQLAPASCRICGTNALDTSVRRSLLWRNTTAASNASDILELGVPAAAGGALALSGYLAGGTRTAAEDVLVTAEAVSAALLATQIVKYATGRSRPYAWADPAAARGKDANLSLWSGHTAATFAAAAAAGQVARMRGYRAWRWIMALGFAGAAACGYYRIAADRHWATDVVAGAAAGTAAGLGLPPLLHGPRAGDGPRLTVLPTGVAGEF